MRKQRVFSCYPSEVFQIQRAFWAVRYRPSVGKNAVQPSWVPLYSNHCACQGVS